MSRGCKDGRVGDLDPKDPRFERAARLLRNGDSRGWALLTELKREGLELVERRREARRSRPKASRRRAS